MGYIFSILCWFLSLSQISDYHHLNLFFDLWIIWMLLLLLFCVVVLRPWYTSKVMSGRSVNLTTLFLGRLRPPKRLTSTSCIYLCQLLTTAPLETAEGETKVCGQTGSLLYRNKDLWLRSQVPYRLLRGRAHLDESISSCKAFWRMFLLFYCILHRNPGKKTE